MPPCGHRLRIGGIAPLIALDPIRKAIVIGIRIEQVDEAIAIRISPPSRTPKGHLRAICQAVAIGVGPGGIGAVDGDLVDIREAIAIGIDCRGTVRGFIRESALVAGRIIGGHSEVVDPPVFQAREGSAGGEADVDGNIIRPTGEAIVNLIAG
jgi:hypothetical protein